MKKIYLFRLIIVIVLSVSLLDCNGQKNEVTIKTTDVYNRVTGKFEKIISIVPLSKGQKAVTSVTILNDCSEVKETVVAKHQVKKPQKPLKKIETVVPPVVPIVPEKDSLDKPDTLNIRLEIIDTSKSKDPSLLYSYTSVLRMKTDGTINKSQFNYNFVPTYKKVEFWPRAKKHLVLGSIISTIGAITFTATMFQNPPTFSKYNGLGYFDHANKYYDKNVAERKRLTTLKWVRGVGIGIGVLGGLEIIYGIHLLKDAKVLVTPKEIILIHYLK